MGDAYQCDRCGDLHEGAAPYAVCAEDTETDTHPSRPYSNARLPELAEVKFLCDTCAVAHRGFMGEEIEKDSTSEHLTRRSDLP